MRVGLEPRPAATAEPLRRGDPSAQRIDLHAEPIGLTETALSCEFLRASCVPALPESSGSRMLKRTLPDQRRTRRSARAGTAIRCAGRLRDLGADQTTAWTCADELTGETSADCLPIDTVRGQQSERDRTFDRPVGPALICAWSGGLCVQQPAFGEPFAFSSGSKAGHLSGQARANWQTRHSRLRLLIAAMRHIKS